ncbi:MAG: phosphatase PAP2 family protein [Nitrospirales bacterium]
MTDLPPSPSLSVPSVLAKHASSSIIGLSILLFIVLFATMGQVDHPTLTIVHGFTDPLVDQIGDIGNELGEGLTLVLLSLAIGGIGLWINSDRWKFAGLYSLLAHGISGLITQILKHSLSRPRPRLMDTTSWDIGPTLESGLDSFPSGHTSASFSVAMVFAYYFPKGRFVWFGLASFNAICRVIKGSHFPTDVLGGILLGIGSGLVLVYARDTWKEATARALAHGLPWLMTAFGLLWILVPHPGIELDSNFSLVIGLNLIMVGLILRLWWIRECTIVNSSSGLKVPTWPRLLMGLGLATSTGSIIVVGASVLTGIIWWLGTQSESLFQTKSPNNLIAGLNPIWTEAILGIGMFLLALLTFSIHTL